jgi:hypothetical protein
VTSRARELIALLAGLGLAAPGSVRADEIAEAPAEVAETGAETGVETETEPGAESETETETVAVAETVAEPEPEPEPEPVSEPVPVAGERVAETLAAPRRHRTVDDLRLGREDAGFGSPGSAWAAGGLFGGSMRDDSLLMAYVDLGLRLGIGRDARVALDWGVAFADTNVLGVYVSPTTTEPFGARVLRTEARNADLTFEWMPFVSDDVRVGVGVGVAIPVAAGTRLPSSPETQAALDASTLVQEAYLASNGGWYAWRYRPERAAVYLPVTVAIALGPDTLLSLEGAAALGFRVLGGSGCPADSAPGASCDVAGDVMLAADIGTAFLPELRMGVRASLAALALGIPNADVQPAIEPWTRIELAPISILLRGTLGIGGPYGVGGAASRDLLGRMVPAGSFVGWGLHASVGVDFGE